VDGAAEPPLFDHIRLALAPLGEVRIRAMFGGHGVSVDGLSVGLIADGRLYLKVDGENEPRHVALGLGRFVYDMKGKPAAMSYAAVPTEAYAVPAVLTDWAEGALGAARRAAAAKAGRRSGGRRG
jgi:DNA transformation protein